MSSFAANFSIRSLFGQQRRVRLVPWMVKTSAICCSSGGRNGPVRYIPKTNLKAEVPQTPYRPSPSPKNHVKNDFVNKGALKLEGLDGGKRQSRKERPHHANKEVEKEIDHFEEAVRYEYLDRAKGVVGELRVHQGKMTPNEDASGPEKNLKAGLPRNTPDVPCPGSENHVRNNFGKESALSVEGPIEGKRSKTSPVLNEKSQIRNKGPYYANKEVEEEFDHCEEALKYECLEEDEEVVEESGIRQGRKTCSEDAPQAGKTKQDAEKAAIGLLAKRAYSAAELKKKLLGKSFSLDITDAVIMDFHSRGLISDSMYAEIYSRSRWTSSSWGPRRIKQALFKKGVSGVEADNALKLVFQDSDSAHDEESSLVMSKATMDRLYVQASKQWLRGLDVPDETRKSRIIRWLQYRGFNWGVVSVILKKLESEHRS